MICVLKPLSPATSHHYTGLLMCCFLKALRLRCPLRSSQSFHLSHLPGLLTRKTFAWPPVKGWRNRIANKTPSVVFLHTLLCRVTPVCVKHKRGFWLSKTHAYIATPFLSLNAFSWCGIWKAHYLFVLCFTVNGIGRDDISSCIWFHCLHLH